MRRLIFIPLLFVLFAFGDKTESEQLNYEVIVFNKTIGSFTATHTELNGLSEYHLESNISAWVFKHLDFKYSMSSSYNNSELVQSDLKDWLNQDLRTNSTVRFDGSKYVITTKENSLTYDGEKVDYSAATLFFQEPVGRTHLFSENYGIDLPITNLGEHKYMLELPNGDQNFYEYENGKVISVEMNKKLVNVRMRVLRP